MSKDIIRSERAGRPLGDYSLGWVVSGGKIIFLSGQVSVDKNGNYVGEGDMGLQTRTVLENIKRVLEGAGASMKDVIKINIYTVDMVRYRQTMKDIQREFFPDNFPASTLLEVKSLARPQFLVEIEAIAAVD